MNTLRVVCSRQGMCECVWLVIVLKCVCTGCVCMGGGRGGGGGGGGGGEGQEGYAFYCDNLHYGNYFPASLFCSQLNCPVSDALT